MASAMWPEADHRNGSRKHWTAEKYGIRTACLGTVSRLPCFRDQRIWTASNHPAPKSLATVPAPLEPVRVEPAQPTTAASPPRLWSLDALRGGCALVVFLSHWHLWSSFPPRPGAEQAVRDFGGKCYDAFVALTWPTGGHHPAVICFFVLSGFCIHYPFAWRAQAGQPRTNWPDYFRRRFWRIMPVYWAACLLGLVFVLVETRHPGGSPLLTLHATAPVEEIIVRFAAVSGIYPREIFSGNYLLNTVAVEILMYALYPLFFRYAMRGLWVNLGLLFVLFQLLAVVLLKFVTPFWVFNSVLMLGLFWYVGALAAQLYVTRHTVVPGLWFLGSWVAYLALKAVPHFYGITLLWQLAWAIVCALGILWALRREQLHPDSRDRRVVAAMRYSGKISYSLYAVHTPAIMLATWGLLVVAGTTDYFVQLAANLTASVAATLLTYYGVERVFYRPRV
jgi:peptidoglycan/LPS O-acetylase OafA/YrhL